MDREMLAKFRTVLENNMKELLGGVGNLPLNLERIGEVQDPMDLVDFASTQYDQELIYKIWRRNRERIREIGDALHRIHSGKFGICSECLDDIGLNRLRVQPTTTVCIVCKREQEVARRIKAA
jgi:DnaK suppressor protein